MSAPTSSSVSDWQPLVCFAAEAAGPEADHYYLRGAVPGLLPLYRAVQSGPQSRDAPGVQGHVRLCGGHRCALGQVGHVIHVSALWELRQSRIFAHLFGTSPVTP